MESTAFFEKKISLTPTDFNDVKNNSIDSLLEKKAIELMEKKCSEQGFVISGTIKLISRSMGYFEAARFTGDAIYYVKLEGKIIYPADGVRVIGEVIRKNKMGLYIDYNKAIRIQIPRDLHIGSKEYEEVEVGNIVEVELKRSKFQINDPYILASGIFITKKTDINSAKRDNTEETVEETIEKPAEETTEETAEETAEETTENTISEQDNNVKETNK